MKKIHFFLLIFIAILFSFCKKDNNYVSYKSGYSSFNDTIRIAVVGSSHVAQVGADLVGGQDSLWHRKYAVRLQAITGNVVILYQINSLGGRTIGSIDNRKITGRVWSFTDYEPSFGLVDSVLKVKPNIVIISAQSNEIANGMPCDTVIACYKSVIDTLKARGVAFIITDGLPRQTYFPGGISAQTYHDSTVKFNNWLYANYNRNTARMYIKLYDSIVGYRPFPNVLGPDSLHTNTVGKTYTLNALMECPLTEGILGNYILSVANYSVKKINNNSIIELKSGFRGQYIKVSVSNDYVNFTELRTLNYFNNTRDSITFNLENTGHLWYKFEFINKTKKFTITRRIN